jgi:hypothetical protein
MFSVLKSVTNYLARSSISRSNIFRGISGTYVKNLNYNSHVEKYPKQIEILGDPYPYNKLDSLEALLKNPRHCYRNSYVNIDFDNFKYQFSDIVNEQEKNLDFVSPRNSQWLSRYGNIKDVKDYILNNKIRIVELLVLNKNFCVDNDKASLCADLDALLGFLYFESKDNLNHCIIDGWEVCFNNIGVKKHGSINYDDNYNFSRKNLLCLYGDYDKLVAARAIIEIMNHTEISRLNLHNYYAVNKWLHINEKLILDRELKMKIEINNVKDPVKFNNNLKIRVSKVLNLNYIISQIDNCIEEEFNCANNNLDNPVEFKKPMYHVEVDKECNVDLSQFESLLSRDRLIYLKNHFKMYQLANIYCGYVPPELLLCKLYEMSDYSFMNKKKEILTEENAKELLTKNKNICYIGPARIFVNFENYPIICGVNYNNYNTHSVRRCLKLAKKTLLKGSSNKDEKIKKNISPIVEMYNE